MSVIVAGAIFATGGSLAVAESSAESVETGSWDDLVLKDPDTDTWKASAWYHEPSNEICIRAYNSISSAYAEIYVSTYGTELRHFKDYGGDTRPTCRIIQIQRENQHGSAFLKHYRGAGQPMTAYGAKGFTI